MTSTIRHLMSSCYFLPTPRPQPFISPIVSLTSSQPPHPDLHFHPRLPFPLTPSFPAHLHFRYYLNFRKSLDEKQLHLSVGLRVASLSVCLPNDGSLSSEEKSVYLWNVYEQRWCWHGYRSCSRRSNIVGAGDIKIYNGLCSRVLQIAAR